MVPDYLGQHADNVYFVAGAYLFAFLPWVLVNNVDFVSQKWRDCRRKHLCLVSLVLAIAYIAVYAEAQRRDNDNKEFGAALAALAFYVLKLARTVVGLVQLIPFMAWCNEGVTSGAPNAVAETAVEVGIEIVEGTDDPNVRGDERNGARNAVAMVFRLLDVVLSWCRRVLEHIRAVLGGVRENAGRDREGEEEIDGPAVEVDVNDSDDVVEYTSTLQVTSEESSNVLVASNSEVSEQAVESAAEIIRGPDDSNAESSERGSRKRRRSMTVRRLRNTFTKWRKRRSGRGRSFSSRSSQGDEQHRDADDEFVEPTIGGHENSMDSGEGAEELRRENTERRSAREERTFKGCIPLNLSGAWYRRRVVRLRTLLRRYSESRR